VLRILQVIAGNAAAAPATVRLPGTVPTPARFRGRVVLDPARCVACGTCAYVCVSGAVTGGDAGGGYAWAYEPGRCAFCARCLDHCIGGALSMEERAAPAYERPGELRLEVTVPFPRCVSCGAPTRPAPEVFLARAFPRVGPQTRELARRCERCRRREAQRGVAAAAGVGAAAGRGGEGER
jgi:Fe-S-cluster-containing hydrogenase component 2